MSKLKITLEDLFNIPGAEIFNPDSFEPSEHVSADSRDIKNGSIFFALKGDKFDGHDFIHDAVNNGAKAIVIEKASLEKFDDIEAVIVTVDDTTKAYGVIAAEWRNKLKAVIFAISGSNGKTSTKDMLADILSVKFHTNKTLANNNNHIGVPLSILAADDKCEVLVLELGTNHFGEIEYIAKIAKPDYAMLTNIGDSHLEFLDSREGVYKEKSAMLTETIKHKGICFLNNDDPLIKKYAGKIKNKITFGFTGKPDAKGEIIGYTPDGRPIVNVKYKNHEIAVELPLYGIANAKNFLASCAAAFKLGLSEEEIEKGVEKLKPTKGRMQVTSYKNFMLIDDTYNASPASVESAVETLENISKYENKILILGDIFELGRKGAKLHQDLYKIIPNKKSYSVFTIGELMENLNKKLKRNITKKHFGTREEFAEFLTGFNFSDSAVLVKGSRGMKMEEFVKLIADRGE